MATDRRARCRPAAGAGDDVECYRPNRRWRLIGLARVLDDGMLYASVWDVLVARFWQRHGIGRALMVVVLERTEGRRLVALVATKAGESLYRALGFTECSAGSTALFLRPDSSAPDRKGGMPDG